MKTSVTTSPAMQMNACRPSLRSLLMRFSLLPPYCLPGRLGGMGYWLRISATAFSALPAALTISFLSFCKALSQLLT